MTAFFSPRLGLALLAVALLLFFASPALAGPCFGNAFIEALSNRSRMIQISIVAVIAGICILWKR